MTPRERFLAAVRRQDVDYPPCVPIFWSSPEVDGYRWTSDEERLDVCVNRLGVDAVLHFGLGVSRDPEVTERTWEERVSGDPYPHLHKVIETPDGPLSCTVRKTEDWPHGDDVPLFSDFVVSRLVKPWLVTEADVDRFRHVWGPLADLTDDDLARAIAPVRALADRFSVPIVGVAGYGLTLSLSLFGAQGAVMASVDAPELLDRVVELDHQVTLRSIGLLARAGVHLLSRNGWYETTDFWSPAQVERFLAARHRAELRLAHDLGLPVSYTVCTGVVPLIPYLQRQEFDCLLGIEPVLGDQDMSVIARELCADKALWAGLSAPLHIGRSTPEGVRRAVRDFYAVFGRRGTLLAAIPSIRPQWPWENVVAMIDEWRRLRGAT